MRDLIRNPVWKPEDYGVLYHRAAPEVVVVTPPKTGHTSIWHHLENVHTVYKNEWLAMPDYVIMIVREPLERLKSAYRFCFSHIPYEQFIDMVLDTNHDSLDIFVHTQHSMLLGRVPDRVMTIQTFAAEWPGLKRLNMSRPAVLPAYREAELAALYADDYALLATAT